MRRILIIEDDPDLAEVYRMALEDQGYRIVGAYTAPAEAIANFAQVAPEDRPQFIILDEHLEGGVSGARSIPALRSAFPGARIILATADAAAHPDDGAGAIGADAVEAKPFSLDTLVKTVERLA